MSEVKIEVGLKFTAKNNPTPIYTIVGIDERTVRVAWDGMSNFPIEYYITTCETYFKNGSWEVENKNITAFKSNKNVSHLGNFLSNASKYTGNSEGETGSNKSGLKFL